MISSASHPHPQPTPAQLQAHKAAQDHASEQAKLRSQKPTDKNVPDGVEDVVIGDGVEQYKKLREVERRLDAAIMKKRLDIQDSVNRSMKVGRHCLLLLAFY
jgi:SWI/SNF-related matrix-associated actin-dependent regulator of chromatin subfamily D